MFIALGVGCFSTLGVITRRNLAVWQMDHSTDGQAVTIFQVVNCKASFHQDATGRKGSPSSHRDRRTKVTGLT